MSKGCGGCWGIKILKPHLSDWPWPHSSFHIHSFVKAVATNTLKEPLLLHQGGSKINEAMAEDGEKQQKSRHTDPFTGVFLKIHCCHNGRRGNGEIVVSEQHMEMQGTTAGEGR